MDIEQLTRDIAADNIILFAKQGRLVQGEWHGNDGDGREIACLLGAIHPDINGSKDCPASVMPEWLAQCIPILFDGVPADRAIDIGIRFADALRTGNTDESVMRSWLIRIVEDAVQSATPVGEPPAYWAMVADACNQVCVALRNNEGLEEAKSAANDACSAVPCIASSASAYTASCAARFTAIGDVNSAISFAIDGACASGKYSIGTCDRLFVALIEEMTR